MQQVKHLAYITSTTLLGCVALVVLLLVCSIVFGTDKASAQVATTLDVPLLYRPITPAERSQIEQPNFRNVYGSNSNVINGGPGSRTINAGFTNPQQRSEYSTGVYYAASASPNIPACAREIRARLGGNLTLRYRGNNGTGFNQANPPGRWGNNYTASPRLNEDRFRDYPEVFYGFFHSGAFTGDTAQELENDAVEELIGAPFPFSGTDPRLGRRAYEFAVYSSPAVWHGVTAAQAREFTLAISAEIMDSISNGGRQWSFNVSGNPVLQLRWDDSACPRFQPYHKVYGGDVSVGAGFGSGCVKNTSATIIGWNSTSGGPGNRGAGAQLAAFAIGQINRFATGQQQNNGNPKSLTFANTGAGFPNTDYGGGLGEQYIPCINNYWNPSGGVVPSPINPATNGSFTHTGNLALNVNSGGIGTGRRVTVYVDGNVYIPANINYQSTTYGSSIANIPSFRLIVRGNIYVGSGVTELNGLFVAMPRTGVADSGKFYTCGRSNFTPPTAAQMRSDNALCDNQLTVYGVVVADTIKFLRKHGTIADAVVGETYRSGGQPAEKFIYTPEMWLTSDFGGGGEFDGYGTMPPIL